MQVTSVDRHKKIKNRAENSDTHHINFLHHKMTHDNNDNFIIFN